jgi:hypothetical protein
MYLVHQKAKVCLRGERFIPLQIMMIAIPFTLFLISALFVAGGTPLASIIVGGLWGIGIYCFFEDQINT